MRVLSLCVTAAAMAATVSAQPDPIAPLHKSAMISPLSPATPKGP